MSQVGNIADFRVPIDDNGRPRGFAFVDFQDPRTADYASDLMNNMMLWDRRIRVENAYPITEVLSRILHYPLPPSSPFPDTCTYDAELEYLCKWR